MLTPIEIQGKTFKSGRGYKKEEIDEFLSTVGKDYEVLYKENLELKDKLNTLTEGLNYYKSIENTLQKALVLAEKTSNDTTENANKRAKTIESEARVKAENIENEAKAKAESLLAESKQELLRLEAKMVSMAQEYEKYRTQCRQMAKAQLELLEGAAYRIDFKAKDINTAPVSKEKEGGISLFLQDAKREKEHKSGIEAGAYPWPEDKEEMQSSVEREAEKNAKKILEREAEKNAKKTLEREAEENAKKTLEREAEENAGKALEREAEENAGKILEKEESNKKKVSKKKINKEQKIKEETDKEETKREGIIKKKINKEQISKEQISKGETNKERTENGEINNIEIKNEDKENIEITKNVAEYAHEKGNVVEEINNKEIKEEAVNEGKTDEEEIAKEEIYKEKTTPDEAEKNSDMPLENAEGKNPAWEDIKRERNESDFGVVNNGVVKQSPMNKKAVEGGYNGEEKLSDKQDISERETLKDIFERLKSKTDSEEPKKEKTGAPLDTTDVWATNSQSSSSAAFTFYQTDNMQFSHAKKENKAMEDTTDFEFINEEELS